MKYAFVTNTSSRGKETLTTMRYSSVEEAKKAGEYIVSNHKDMKWQDIYDLVEVDDKDNILRVITVS